MHSRINEDHLAAPLRRVFAAVILAIVLMQHCRVYAVESVPSSPPVQGLRAPVNPNHRPASSGATPVNLDLSSTAPSATAGILPNFAPAYILVDGQQKFVTSTTPLTPAETAALAQVLNTSRQSLVLGVNGNAVGGTMMLLPRFSNLLDSLTIPHGVTVLNRATDSMALSLPGVLSVAGSLYAFTTNSSISSVTISAANVNVMPGGLISSLVPPGGISGMTGNGWGILPAVTNLGLTVNASNSIVNAGTISSASSLRLNAGGGITNGLPEGVSGPQPVMQSLGDLNMITGTGTITNSGLITSTNAAINMSTAVPTTALNVLANGGTFQALEGAINIRDQSFSAKANTYLTGNYLSKEVNVFSGSGIVTADLGQISGRLNINAGEAHVSASTDVLNLGTLVITGDPGFYNKSGAVNLNLPLTIFGAGAGADLVVVAATNITATGTGDIDIGSTTANGGNMEFIAGAAITASASGQQDNVHGDVLFITGPSSTGGKIDLTGATIGKLSSSSTAANAGNITLVALAGSAPDSGTITLSNSTSIVATGASGFSNGVVNVLAGASPASTSTTINLGQVTTYVPGGAETGGSITLATATPTLPPFAIIRLILSSDGSVAGSGVLPFLFGATQPHASISTGALAAGIANQGAGDISILPGENVQITGPVVGCNINIASNSATALSTVSSGPVINGVVGPITALSAAGTDGGAITLTNAGGGIALGKSLTSPGTNLTFIASGDISTTGASAISLDTSSNSANGGRINMVAGAQVAASLSDVHVTGASGGGSIDLTAGAGISSLDSSSSFSGGSGGNVTLIAFGDLTGRISIPNAVTVKTGGAGTGVNGNVIMIAGDSTASDKAIGGGFSIDTSGGTGGNGNIILANATPVAMSPAAGSLVTITDGAMSITTGVFSGRTLQHATIDVGNVSTTNALVQIYSAGSINFGTSTISGCAGCILVGGSATSSITNPPSSITTQSNTDVSLPSSMISLSTTNLDMQTINNGSISVSSDLNVSKAVTLIADGSGHITTMGATVISVPSVSLLSDSGDINVSVGGVSGSVLQVDTMGDVNATAPADLTLASSTVGGTYTLSTVGNILVNENVIAAQFNLQAFTINGDGGLSSLGSLDLSLLGPASFSSKLNTQVASALITASGSDVWLSNSGNITLLGGTNIGAGLLTVAGTQILIGTTPADTIIADAGIVFNAGSVTGPGTVLSQGVLNLTGNSTINANVGSLSANSASVNITQTGNIVLRSITASSFRLNSLSGSIDLQGTVTAPSITIGLTGSGTITGPGKLVSTGTTTLNLGTSGSSGVNISTGILTATSSGASLSAVSTKVIRIDNTNLGSGALSVSAPSPGIILGVGPIVANGGLTFDVSRGGTVTGSALVLTAGTLYVRLNSGLSNSGLQGTVGSLALDGPGPAGFIFSQLTGDVTVLGSNLGSGALTVNVADGDIVLGALTTDYIVARGGINLSVQNAHKITGPGTLQTINQALSLTLGSSGLSTVTTQSMSISATSSGASLNITQAFEFPTIYLNSGMSLGSGALTVLNNSGDIQLGFWANDTIVANGGITLSVNGASKIVGPATLLTTGILTINVGSSGSSTIKTSVSSLSGIGTGGSLTVNQIGAIVLNGGINYGSGSLSITSNSAITVGNVAGDTVLANGTLQLVAPSGIAGSGTLQSSGILSLRSTSGAIGGTSVPMQTAASVICASAVGDIVITNNGAVMFTGSSSGGNVTFKNTGNVTLQDYGLLSNAAESNSTFTVSASPDSGGNRRIFIAGNVNAGAISLTSTFSASGNGGIQNFGGGGVLTGSALMLIVDGSSPAPGAQDIGSQALSIATKTSDLTVYSGGAYKSNAWLSNRGSVSFRTDHVNGDLSLTNIGSVELEPCSVAGDFTVTATPDATGNGRIELLSGSVTASSITLTSNSSGSGLGGIVTAGGTLTANAIQLIDTGTGSAPGARDIGTSTSAISTQAGTLTAQSGGNIWISNIGTVSATGTAGGALRIDNTGSIALLGTNSGDTFSITTTPDSGGHGEILIGGDIDAVTSISLNATSALAGIGGIQNTVSGGTLSAMLVSLRSSGSSTASGAQDIGSASSPITLNASTVTATSTSGSVFLSAAGDVAIDNTTVPSAASAVFVLSAAGSITATNPALLAISSPTTMVSSTGGDIGGSAGASQPLLISSGSTSGLSLFASATRVMNAGGTINVSSINSEKVTLFNGGGSLTATVAFTLTAAGNVVASNSNSVAISCPQILLNVGGGSISGDGANAPLLVNSGGTSGLSLLAIATNVSGNGGSATITDTNNESITLMSGTFASDTLTFHAVVNFSAIGTIAAGNNIVLTTDPTTRLTSAFPNQLNLSETIPSLTIPGSNGAILTVLPGSIVSTASGSISANGIDEGSLLGPGTYGVGNYSVTISGGPSGTLTITPTTLVTPAEWVAAIQVQNSSSQSLIIGTNNAASGGYFTIDSINVPVGGFSNVAVPSAVTGYVSVSTLQTNVLTNDGILQASGGQSNILISSAGTTTGNLELAGIGSFIPSSGMVSFQTATGVANSLTIDAGTNLSMSGALQIVSPTIIVGTTGAAIASISTAGSSITIRPSLSGTGTLTFLTGGTSSLLNLNGGPVATTSSTGTSIGANFTLSSSSSIQISDTGTGNVTTGLGSLVASPTITASVSGGSLGTSETSPFSMASGLVVPGTVSLLLTVKSSAWLADYLTNDAVQFRNATTPSSAEFSLYLSTAGNITASDSTTLAVASPSIKIITTAGNIGGGSGAPLNVASLVGDGTLSQTIAAGYPSNPGSGVLPPQPIPTVITTQASGSVWLAHPGLVQLIDNQAATFNLSTGSGILQDFFQSSNTAITSSSINLWTFNGGVGNGLASLKLADNGTLRINVNGPFSAVSASNVGSLTLLASSSVGSFSLTNSSSLIVGDITSTNGSISLLSGAGQLAVSSSSSLVANSGSLTLNELSTSGSIAIGQNAALYSHGGAVSIFLGSSPNAPTTKALPLGTPVTATRVANGKISFGANGIAANGPMNYVASIGSSSLVTFDTNGAVASSISLGGNVSITSSVMAQITSLDLTDSSVVTTLRAAQTDGLIGGSLAVTSSNQVVGGSLILLPAELSKTLTSLNIPTNVLVMMNGQGTNLTVNITASSHTNQAVVNGVLQFIGAPTNTIRINSDQTATSLLTGSTSFIFATGDLSFTSNGSITINGPIVTSGALAMQSTNAALGNIAIQGALKANGPMQVSSAGNLTSALTATISSPSISLSAAGAAGVNLQGFVTAYLGQLLINAPGGPISTGRQLLAVGGNASLTAGGGDIMLGAPLIGVSTGSGTGAVALSASGNINTAQAAIVQGASITANALGLSGIAARGALTAVTGQLQLLAPNGGVSSSSQAFGVGGVYFAAGGTISVLGSVIGSTGNITLNAAADITIAKGIVLQAPSLTLLAGGINGINSQSTLISFNGPLQVSATNGPIISNGFISVSGGTATVNSGGSIAFNQPLIDATNGITITATGGLTVTAPIISSKGDISITSGGAISTSAVATVNAANGNLSVISNNGAITLSGLTIATGVPGTGSITITAHGTISLANSILALNSLTLNALGTGSSILQNSAGIVLFSPVISLTADNSINGGGGIGSVARSLGIVNSFSAQPLQLTANSSGGIFIAATGALTINGATSNMNAGSSSGSIAVGTNSGALKVASGALVKANGGNIVLQGSSIEVGANATIYASSTLANVGNVTLRIGSLIFTPGGGPTPANVAVNQTSGGHVYFGPQGISASAPTNTLNAEGRDIIFNTAGLPASFIKLDGGVTITADPPSEHPLSPAGIRPLSVTASVLRPLTGMAGGGTIQLPLAYQSQRGLAPDGHDTGTGSATQTFIVPQPSQAPLRTSAVLSTRPVDVGTVQGNHIGAIPSVQSAIGNSMPVIFDMSALTTHAGDGCIDLPHGKMLCVPSKRSSVSTPFGEVTVGKNAVVLILVTHDGVSIYDLHDENRNDVYIRTGGRVIALAPGTHATITTIGDAAFKQHGYTASVTHRSLTYSDLPSGLHLITSEFSLVSAIQGVPAVARLGFSQSTNDKAAMRRLIKTTAATQCLNKSQKPFQRVLPATEELQANVP